MPSADAPQPLALFVAGWLNYSETFIYDQVQHQRRFRASVIAQKRMPYAARFPYAPVYHLTPVEEPFYFQLGLSARVGHWLDRIRPTIAMAHFGTNGVLALPFVRRRRIPLAVMFHGHDVGGLDPSQRWTARYRHYQSHARAMLDYASVLLCCSTELAERLVEYGAPEEKIVIHRLGIDVSTFAPVERPDRAPTVLMVGRLVEKKGFNDALDAFARVHHKHPEMTLRLVGDGPLRSALESQATALGIGDAVQFLGNQPASAVADAMAAADVLMAPSYVTPSGDRESGTLVLKEAAARGLPTIGTLHGGIPEIIEDETTGYLVAERDVGALAERLTALVTSHPLRQRLGAAAREKMTREYDTVTQNARLESVLAEHVR